MLGKLLKYEFWAMARVMLPLYGGAILIALLMRLLSLLEPAGADAHMFGAAFGMLAFVYVMSILAVVVLTIVFIIHRFYSNLFKDQGYLTHTLPVSVDTLLWSKLISAFCWALVGIVVFVVSIMIIATGFLHDLFFYDLRYFWEFIPYYHMRGFEQLLSLLHSIIGLLAGILMFYAALSIGQLVKRAKILVAVLVYFGMSYALSIISSLVLFAMLSGDLTMTAWNFPAYFYFTVIFTLAQGVGFYFITRSILRYKLNLE